MTNKQHRFGDSEDRFGDSEDRFGDSEDRFGDSGSDSKSDSAVLDYLAAPALITAADIRQFRKEMGLTQRQFAIALGVTRITVCMYEKGHVKISRTVQLAVVALMRRAADAMVWGSETFPEYDQMPKQTRSSDAERVRFMAEESSNIGQLADMAGVTDIDAFLDQFEAIRSRKSRENAILVELRRLIYQRPAADVIQVCDSREKALRAIANLAAG